MPWVGFLVGSRVPLVCCVQCGCFSEACSNVIGLRRRCMYQASGLKGSEPSKGARYRLGRFLKGTHPTKSVGLEGPFSMLPSELVWKPVGPPRPGDEGISDCGQAPEASAGFADMFEEHAWPLPPEGEDPWAEGPPDLVYCGPDG